MNEKSIFSKKKDIIKKHQSSRAFVSKTSWTNDVYPPSEDTFLLEDAIHKHFIPSIKEDSLPRICLEIGCGSGYISASLGSVLGTSSFVLAIDINPQAIQCSSTTIKNHGLNNVDFVLSDMSSGIFLKGGFDLVVFNPPYVPSEVDEMRGEGVERAWAGGHKGRYFIDKFIEILPDILSSKGEALIVTIDQNNPAEVVDNLNKKGFISNITLQGVADQENLNIIYIKRNA